MQKARTVGELKASGYATRSVKDEVRSNLLRKLAAGDTLFPGVLGYEDTVVPRIVNALLARQNFILLGLRGQAKSRIVRELTLLLDDEMPILAGSEVNDDPLNPISKDGRLLVQEHGRADAAGTVVEVGHGRRTDQAVGADRHPDAEGEEGGGDPQSIGDTDDQDPADHEHGGDQERSVDRETDVHTVVRSREVSTPVG